MEAPKIIYRYVREGRIFHNEDYKPVKIRFNEPDAVKYIRADLVELTWEDIKKIELLLVAVECSSARPYSGEDLYKEVLRRFNEFKAGEK